MNAELEKTDIPRFLVDSCKDIHRNYRNILEKSVTDLLHSEACAASFAKQIKLIVETLDTNLRLLKGLKATEAKKYGKEVELLQSKSSKLMDIGRKCNALENETEVYDREKANLKKKKQTFSKLKNMDVKAISDKIVTLAKQHEKFTSEYINSKEELKSQTKDFNEARLYIYRTFNAHSASIDMRFGDNLELFKKNFLDFVQGLKITSQPNVCDINLGSPDAGSYQVALKTSFLSKANSVSGSSQEETSKRIV